MYWQKPQATMVLKANITYAFDQITPSMRTRYREKCEERHLNEIIFYTFLIAGSEVAII